jgi:hypothetical protein
VSNWTSISDEPSLSGVKPGASGPLISSTMKESLPLPASDGDEKTAMRSVLLTLAVPPPGMLHGRPKMFDFLSSKRTSPVVRR